MNRELTALYGAFASGGHATLPELGIQYSDFAVWQRQWLSGAVLDRQRAYWQNRLAGLPTLEHLLERKGDGWKLVALEWERDAADGPLGATQSVVEEIPYGLKVADD